MRSPEVFCSEEDRQSLERDGKGERERATHRGALIDQFLRDRTIWDDLPASDASRRARVRHGGEAGDVAEARRVYNKNLRGRRTKKKSVTTVGGGGRVTTNVVAAGEQARNEISC